MTEEELQKKKKNYIGILTNTHFSTLRNKIIYSLGGDENSKIMTDLFIYLLHINKQQWDEHRLQMTEYGYLYVGNSYDEEGKPYRYNHDLVFFREKNSPIFEKG